MSMMKLSELKCCPFCGNDEYYQHMYVTGSCVFNIRFDGSDDADNTEMYAGLTHTMGAKVYCNGCDKYLGNLNTNTLSNDVKQLIDSGKAYLEIINQ